MDYDYDDSSGGLIATHVKSLVLHPNFELVGAVDTDSDRRSRFNKKYNISAYERIEDLPKKSKIDLVVIATNTKDHFDSFIKIIENFNPRLILCEKPLSSNIQESRKMIDLAISANISLAVNYIRQYDPGIKRLIDIINDGGLGFPLKSCVWYRKGVYNNGSHMISLISRIFGRALDVDIITRGRMFDGWDPEPDFKIKFDKGEVVFLSGNEEDFSYNQMEIYGPKGKVLLDKDDNAFRNPTKPIGPFFAAEEAGKIAKDQGWEMVENRHRGYRRVVASPRPLKIVERESVKRLLESGEVVIAAGGGGIPVIVEEDGSLEGADCVVDKDLASSVLALDIKADCLVMLTGVEHVCLNYGESDQKPLATITIKEAESYMAEGHFPSGSMGPKIQAAVNFLKGGGECVFITAIDKVWEAIAGKTGTRIVP